MSGVSWLAFGLNPSASVSRVISQQRREHARYQHSYFRLPDVVVYPIGLAWRGDVHLTGLRVCLCRVRGGVVAVSDGVMDL